MQRLKLFLFSIFMICSIDLNTMHQKHEFDITKFNEKNYRQKISKIHPSHARDFVTDQLIDSMIVIFELKQENAALQKQLTQAQQESQKAILALSDRANLALNNESAYKKQLIDENESLQILNIQLYKKMKKNKDEYYLKLKAIRSLNESDSV